MQNNFSKCREWVPRGTSQHKWRWLTTLLLILTLGIGQVWGANGDVLFSQDFNSATAVSQNLGAAAVDIKTTSGNNIFGTTAASQFTSLKAAKISNAKGGIAINATVASNGTDYDYAKKFGFRSDDTKASFHLVKSTNFATTAPTAIKVEMNMYYQQLSSGSNVTASFAIGESFSDGEKPGTEKIHSGFTIKGNGTATFCQYNTTTNLVGYATKMTQGSSVKVTWVINNTGETLIYTDPRGEESSLDNDKFDIWVGTTKNVAGAPATSATKGLQNLYIGDCDAKKKFEFYLDDIKVTDLTPCLAPSITTQPSGASLAVGDANPKLSVTANNTTSYIWKESSDGTSHDGSSSLGTSKDFTPSVNTAAQTKYYYCELVNSCNTSNVVKTNIVTVNVVASVVNVTGVSLDKTSQEFTLGATTTTTLTATVAPNDATNKAVSWESSAPTKVSVTDNGDGTADIEGLAEGTATITVTTDDGSYTAICNVTVHPDPCSAWGLGTSYNTTPGSGSSTTAGDLTITNIGGVSNSSTTVYSGSGSVKTFTPNSGSKYLTGSLGGSVIESVTVCISTANTGEGQNTADIVFSSAATFDAENLLNYTGQTYKVHSFVVGTTSDDKGTYTFTAPAGAKSFAVGRNFGFTSDRGGASRASSLSGNRNVYYIQACPHVCDGTAAEKYTVSGEATICAGENTNITLANSQSGAKYVLLKDAAEVDGSEKDGTGSALVWSVSAAGTYTVKAIEYGDYCETEMTGSAVVSEGAKATISTAAQTIYVGGATLTMALAEAAEGAWESSVPEKATISNAGVVTAVAAGTTDITFTKTGGCPSDAVTITVVEPFKVSFDENGGDAPIAAMYGMPSVTLPGATKGTDSFLGWFDGENKIGEADDSYTPTADITLVAHWAAANHVAQIGTTGYETFADAIAAVADGETIQLLQDCSYSDYWTISDKDVTVDLNGKHLSYTGTNYYGVVLNNGTLTVEDQTMTVDPTIDLNANPLNASAITYANSGKWTFTKAGVNILTDGAMVVNSGWMQTVECVACPMYNGIVTVNNGVLVATDNGVLMGNGTNGLGGYTINVHGGILLGMIQSAGYASMAIYHPNTGNLNIDGGTLVSTNGPGVVCRGGESDITGGAIVAIGDGSGKCGDASLVLPAVGVAYDFKAAYPGVASFDATISGTANVSGEAGAVMGNYAGAEPTAEEEAAVAISGGTFNTAVAAALCADGYVPEDKGAGSYGVTLAAVTVDFEASEIQAQTVGTILNNYHYVCSTSNTSEVLWDGGDSGNKPADKGLKIKKADATLSFSVEAGKLVTLKVGSLKGGASIKVNDGDYAELTGANPLSTGASVYTYYYNADVANYVIKTKTGTNDYNIIQSIKIENPYVVTYNPTEGTCATASANYIGTALKLPTPTHATYSFKGWYDAATGGNLIGAAGADYTPTASITLYAQWETVSTDNTLSDLKVGGETVDGFSPSVHTYYVVLPYGTKPENIPAITATANSAKAKQVAIQQAVWTGEPYNCYRAQANVQAEDNSWGYYDVRFSFAPKDMACLIKATVTGDNAMAIDASASMFEGTPDIYKVYGNAETYESKSAPKFQGDGYLGVTLTTAGAAFQEGDVVRVFATKGIDNVAKLYVYSDNTGTAAKQIAESETALVKGYNEAALTAAGEGATSVFLCRAGQYTSWNPCIYDIAVYRAVPKPVLSAITIGGATENAVNQSTKTISLEISAVAAADLANLSVTPTFMSNDPSQTTGAVTSNEGAWVLGANTYLVTDKDGDTETYTINLSAAAGIKEVVISGTLAVLEDETTTLSAVVYDTNDQVASIQDVTWSVKAGDEALASVTSAGVVTGKAVGTAHIIATSVADNTKSAEVAVVVSENPCRAWSNPSSKETGATIGKMVVTPTGIGTLQENMTPYQGASATNAWKLDTKDSRYAEIKFTDNAQFESLLLGVSSKDNDKNYKFAVVCSSAAGDGFAAGVLSATTYEAVDQDEAENLVDVELPVGTKAVRVYRQYTNDYGGDKSVFLYYINACKKELVALTSIAVADKTLAVGVAGTPAVTLTPANADVASYVWEIENDGTGAAVISAKGVISSTATGVVTVKVTATDALNNVVASNVATVNIVNKFVDVAPVTGTTNWNWSGIASENTVISDVDTVLANYYSGSQWERIAGKAANDQYAYRAEGHDCYQGTYLFFKTTVPGMLTINSRYASSGAKIEVNGNEIATLTGNYANYSVAVPAGDVKIVATGGQKMRIKTMKFDADFSSYELTDNALNGYTRPVTEGRYGTICLPNGGVMTGAMLFDLAYFDPDQKKIFFDEVINGTMEAGTPYIFLPNEDVDALKVFYTDAAGAVAGNANGLFGSYTQEIVTPNDGNYILLNNQYCFVNSTAYVGANRAYIKLYGDGHALTASSTSAPQPAPGRRRVSMGVQGEQVATGIEGLNVGDQPIKVVIDGQMYILRGDKMYDATGRLVK